MAFFSIHLQNSYLEEWSEPVMSTVVKTIVGYSQILGFGFGCCLVVSVPKEDGYHKFLQQHIPVPVSQKACFLT